MRSLAWDHSVVLDMLLAPGGRVGGADIREYMLRYLHLAAGDPGGFLVACRDVDENAKEEELVEEDEGEEEEEEEADATEEVLACLRQLETAISRLAGGLPRKSARPTLCSDQSSPRVLCQNYHAHGRC